MTNSSPIPGQPFDLPLILPKRFRPPQDGEIIEYQHRLYRVGGVLGQGYFGAVYECTDEWSNSLVAKVILPRNTAYEQIQESWLKEMQHLIQFRHPHITYIYDAFEYQDTFYLIIERCSSTLEQLIQLTDFRGELWLPYVASDILQALDFMHLNSFVHKDLHAGNVFISWVHDKMVPTKQPVISFKIGDFGISNVESQIDFFTTVLAQELRPPEFLNPTEFGLLDRRVDIYHVGLLFLQIRGRSRTS